MMRENKNFVEKNNIEFSEFRISIGDWFILIFMSNKGEGF
jgi:hypothetical protein